MLELKNVSKTFNPGTVNEKKALDGLSVTLADGDFVTIVGSNGAGKSTLFNAVAGDFYVDEGSVTLDGRDITYLPAYRRSRQIGRLFQDPMRGTAPHMTIEENLALAYLRTAKHQRAFFSRYWPEAKGSTPISSGRSQPFGARMLPCSPSGASRVRSTSSPSRFQETEIFPAGAM